MTELCGLIIDCSLNWLKRTILDTDLDRAYIYNLLALAMRHFD